MASTRITPMPSPSRQKKTSCTHYIEAQFYNFVRSVSDEFQSDDKKTGKAIASSSLAKFTLISILRAAMDLPSLNGWLRALADPTIGPALDRIHEGLSHRRRLQEMAGEAGMSRTRFSVRLQPVIGVTPLDYLIRVLIDFAKNALGKADLPTSLIAIQVGYESESAFSSAFKRIAGLSPKHYRNGWRIRQKSSST